MTGTPEPLRIKAALPGWLRIQDAAWLLFILALIVFTPETNYDLPILLGLLGVFQIVEPRFHIFASRRGRVASVTLKLVFSYLLGGYTHGIASPYHSIFLVPVVSAATTFELGGVIAVTFLAALGYFSFLLPVFTQSIEIPPDFVSLMSLRVSFYAIVAFLVFEQAKAKRMEVERSAESAAQLAESNRSLRKAEASLRRSERLAALGQLTAGLAHELRNPLGTIRASAEMLTKDSAQSKPAVMAEMASYISSEADRMNDLIASFLDFARPLQIHLALSDLSQLLEQVRRDQNGLADERRVELAIERRTAPLTFAFDSGLLRLAISNLVQNALQASAVGTRVQVSVQSDADTVQIRVEDQGVGIEPQQLENIFNPFFTTKPQGVGLGLAIVAKIVDEHGGRIRVASEPGKGTTFQIVLPREQSI